MRLRSALEGDLLSTTRNCWGKNLENYFVEFRSEVVVTHIHLHAHTHTKGIIVIDDVR